MNHAVACSPLPYQPLVILSEVHRVLAMDAVEGPRRTQLTTAALNTLHEALAVADILRYMPFEVVIWQAQNIWNDLLRRIDDGYLSREWKDDFKQLGRAMNIAVDELVIEEGVSAF